jgi:hypothetical protein
MDWSHVTYSIHLPQRIQNGPNSSSNSTSHRRPSIFTRRATPSTGLPVKQMKQTKHREPFIARNNQDHTNRHNYDNGPPTTRTTRDNQTADDDQRSDNNSTTGGASKHEGSERSSRQDIQSGHSQGEAEASQAP